MTQLSLALDAPRLAKQLKAVREVMLAAEPDEWLSYEQVALRAEMRLSQSASISARFRELRSLGYRVDKRRRGNPSAGCWEYRVEEGYGCR